MLVSTPDEIVELIRLSEGRAFSTVDKPEWYCGERKCTHYWYDGKPLPDLGTDKTCFGVCGGLADTIRRDCRFEEDCNYYIRLRTADIEGLRRLIQEEENRKKPRRGVLNRLYSDLLRVTEERKNSLFARDQNRLRRFRMIEGRFLELELK